jgi:ribosomal protein S18 acetylase RimI-like enzyme
LKQLHRGFIRSMYVAPHARGRGIGKALMHEAVHFARAMPGLRQLTLAVTAGNSAALGACRAFPTVPVLNQSRQ